MCDKQRLRPVCAYALSDQSLCLSLEYSMTVKLLTEQQLEFLSLKGGCTCQYITLLEITCLGSYEFWVLKRTVRNKKSIFLLKHFELLILYHFGTKIAYDNELKIHIVELI